ncbi:uncharacterized protein NPIL_574351 [Nephila pilipes]|uniref:Uncharacterized protein n=1 Tax=Nephila pilipes TaxID=299642 RepID=A0A8X6TF07_NEPPI|nr:uncharacterized protein NPIL_574351 [Nephila pilipes]
MYFLFSGNFSRGEKELQQSVEALIKRSLEFPSGDVNGYPALLTHKTSDLLREAEHMLNRVKNLKERRWVKAFILRLKLLTGVLENSVVQNTDDKFSQNASLSYASVSQISTPIHGSTNISIIQQQAEMTATYPVTEAQMKQMLAMNNLGSERQAATSPGLASLMTEKKSNGEQDDELVKELEDLRKIINVDNQKNLPSPNDKEAGNGANLMVKEPEKTAVKEAEKISTITEAASPVKIPARILPSKRMDPSLTDFFIENEIILFKQSLAREVAEMQRLGIVDGDLPYEFLHKVDEYLTLDPNSEHASIIYKQERPIEDMGGLNSNIVDPYNANFWRSPPAVFPTYRSFKDITTNDSIPGIHTGIAPIDQPIFNRQFQTANAHPRANLHLNPAGIQKMIEKLQKENVKFWLKTARAKIAERQNSNGNPNQFLHPDNNSPNNPSMGMIPVNPAYTHVAYPHLINLNRQNPPVSRNIIYGKSITSNIDLNHNTDNEFSDEMKRELRDGKVILLSDSVVRSNFEQNAKSPNETKDGTIEKRKIPKNNSTETK